MSVLTVGVFTLAGCSLKSAGSSGSETVSTSSANAKSSTNTDTQGTNNLPVLGTGWTKADTENAEWKVNDKPVSIVAYTAPANSNLKELCTSLVNSVDTWAKKNNYTLPAEKNSFPEGLEYVVSNPDDAIEKCSNPDPSPSSASSSNSSRSLGDTFDDIDGTSELDGGRVFIIHTSKEGTIGQQCTYQISDTGEFGGCFQTVPVGEENDYVVAFAS